MKEHYYHEETEIPMQLGTVKLWLQDREYEFYTSPPVFGWRIIDKGTILLADKMEVPADAMKLLDMGCGYGVLGLTAALRWPQLGVTMVDISGRAIALAKKNIEKYQLGVRVKAIQGDCYEALKEVDEKGKETLEKFDIIVTNPPYSAGKEVVNKIIQEAPNHLEKGGLFEMVGKHSKGGKMYMAEMEKVFETVEETERKSGYRIYIGRKG